MRNTVTRTMS